MSCHQLRAAPDLPRRKPLSFCANQSCCPRSLASKKRFLWLAEALVQWHIPTIRPCLNPTNLSLFHCPDFIKWLFMLKFICLRKTKLFLKNYIIISNQCCLDLNYHTKIALHIVNYVSDKMTKLCLALRRQRQFANLKQSIHRQHNSFDDCNLDQNKLQIEVCLDHLFE